jgi:hypothetical protein
MAITITGKLTMVSVKQMTDPDYLGMSKYSPNTERTLHYLNCCLTTSEGKRYFFDSPKVSRKVANCPGAAIVMYDIEGEASKWFREEGDMKVATAERVNTNRLVPLVKEGDVVTLRVSVKVEKPTYTSVKKIG